MNRATTSDSVVATADATAAALAGLGVLTMALFPFAIPILLLTAACALPLVILGLVVALPVAIVGGVVRVLRRLAERAP